MCVCVYIYIYVYVYIYIYICICSSSAAREDPRLWLSVVCGALGIESGSGFRVLGF